MCLTSARVPMAKDLSATVEVGFWKEGGWMTCLIHYIYTCIIVHAQCKGKRKEALSLSHQREGRDITGAHQSVHEGGDEGREGREHHVSPHHARQRPHQAARTLHHDTVVLRLQQAKQESKTSVSISPESTKWDSPFLPPLSQSPLSPPHRSTEPARQTLRKVTSFPPLTP